MNRSLLIESIDPEELTAAIAAAVVAKLGPVIRQASTPEQTRCAGRDQMAKILGWSVAKLDRRTAEGLPSMMDEGRRIYIVDEVFTWLKKGTPDAEAKARERQAPKLAKARAAREANAERDAARKAKNKAPARG